MTLPRNPKLAQSLPAEKRFEFENSQEHVDSEDQIVVITDLRGKVDPDSAGRRNKLYAERRKPSNKELRKWQKLQPNKLEPGGVDNAVVEGHHRTTFNRTRFLMRERDRLAPSLLEVAPLRSAIGLAALRDLVALYQKDTEIEFRLGLEPENAGAQRAEGKQKLVPPYVSSTKADYHWRHLYDCSKRDRIAALGFAEL